MITLRITDNIEDIRQWTGLPSDNFDEALWNVGFDLDDWDMCIESDVRLVDDYGDTYMTEAWWLASQIANYCCGCNEVEYNGKWYYTVHHA